MGALSQDLTGDPFWPLGCERGCPERTNANGGGISLAGDTAAMATRQSAPGITWARSLQPTALVSGLPSGRKQSLRAALCWDPTWESLLSANLPLLPWGVGEGQNFSLGSLLHPTLKSPARGALKSSKKNGGWEEGALVPLTFTLSQRSLLGLQMGGGAFCGNEPPLQNRLGGAPAEGTITAGCVCH